MSSNFWSFDFTSSTWTNISLNERSNDKNQAMKSSKDIHVQDMSYENGYDGKGWNRRNLSRMVQMKESPRLGIVSPSSYIPTTSAKPTKKTLLSAQRSNRLCPTPKPNHTISLPKTLVPCGPNRPSSSKTSFSKVPTVSLTRKQQQKEDHKFRSRQVEKEEQNLHVMTSASPVRGEAERMKNRLDDDAERRLFYNHNDSASESAFPDSLLNKVISVNMTTEQDQDCYYSASKYMQTLSECVSDLDESETSDITTNESDEFEDGEICMLPFPSSVEVPSGVETGRSNEVVTSHCDFFNGYEVPSAESISTMNDRCNNEVTVLDEGSFISHSDENSCVSRSEPVRESQPISYSAPLHIQKLREKRDAKMKFFVSSMSKAKSFELAVSNKPGTRDDHEDVHDGRELQENQSKGRNQFISKLDSVLRTMTDRIVGDNNKNEFFIGDCMMTTVEEMPSFNNYQPNLDRDELKNNGFTKVEEQTLLTEDSNNTKVDTNNLEMVERSSCDHQLGIGTMLGDTMYKIDEQMHCNRSFTTTTTTTNSVHKITTSNDTQHRTTNEWFVRGRKRKQGF